jgi:hypothetical protein
MRKSQISEGNKTFLFSKRPVPLRDPPVTSPGVPIALSVAVNRPWMKPTDQRNPLSSLGMHVAVPPLPHVASWCPT